ncbi:MAG TPA: hypothetical protein VJA66_18785, partial [Thermoanaerobaculia bacterium]
NRMRSEEERIMSGARFVCHLDAFTPGERVHHAGLIEQLSPLLESARELPDGYALRFMEDGSVFARLAEWMRLESACCPHLKLELNVVGKSGPVELRLTGAEGVKEFLREQVPMVTEALAAGDGWTSDTR